MNINELKNGESVMLKEHNNRDYNEGKHYFITYQDEETKMKNLELYETIKNNGKCEKNEWSGDYLVTTYEYNDKIYETFENMEYGIISEIVEYEK